MKKRSTFGWLDLFRGVLFIALGIVILFAPGIALRSLILLLGAMALVSGISEIVFYAKIRKYTAFESKVSLITGVVSSLAGLILLINPSIGTSILNFIFPVWFIVHCLSRIVDFGLIKQVSGTGVSILVLCLNILGLLFGILMLFNPMLFTMSAGILLAANLIILGVSSVIEAFSGLGASNTNWHIS